MKKVVKVISFLVVFCVLFKICQNVLHYRWSGDEDLYTRNMQYKQEAKNSIDVLFFGTSEIYAGIFPAAIYDQEGITSVNFGISYKSAPTAYYQLKFALKYQKPRIVVCDFSSLYVDSLPSEIEALYRKVVDTMPDFDIKNGLIQEIAVLEPHTSLASWYFPILRYHTMWSGLKKENFEKDYVVDDSYAAYRKGALLGNAYFDNRESMVISPDCWQSDGSNTTLSDISIKYYDKFISLCKENNIQVVALFTPNLVMAKTKVANWEVSKNYFETRGGDCIDYNTYEEFLRLDLSLEEDFYDAGKHLNYNGAIKLSRDLATKLKAYGLPDHRGTPGFEEWDSYWGKFCEDYQYTMPN